MSIKIHLLGHLYLMAGNNYELEAIGKTVGDCLGQVIERYPDLGPELLGLDGKLKPHVIVWVNTEATYPEELESPVKDRDELYVMAGSG